MDEGNMQVIEKVVDTKEGHVYRGDRLVVEVRRTENGW